MRRLLIVATCLLLSTQALADVTVFRAVARKNATFALINDNQWRIDADGLSTFEPAKFNVPGKQCMVSFVITGVDSPAPQGDHGPVANMPDGYVGTYTPEHGGEGHWSISRPGGTLPSDITAYVIAHRVAAPNPSYTGGSSSQCQTPNAPNVLRRRRR